MWPMANSQAENFNKALIKTVRSANVHCCNWRRELFQFLRHYRCSPHSSTLFKHHQLLFGKEPAPSCQSFWQNGQLSPTTRVYEQDAIVKEKMKTHAGKRAKASRANLKQDEVVLVKQPKLNKRLLRLRPHRWS